MRPSPEIVIIGRRARFRSWGDTLAAPVVLALVGIPLLVWSLILVLRSGPAGANAAWLLAIGLSLTMVALIILGVFLLFRARLARRQADLEAHLDELIDMLGGASRMFALERIARLCALRASRRWRGPRLFDIDLWDRATADRCPRVILFRHLSAAPAPIDSPHEEIDLESEGAVPRRKIARELIVCGFVLAVGAALWSSTILAGAGSHALGALLTIGALTAAYQTARSAGWRAVAIRSAIASPGRIEFGGLAGVRAFIIHDSVLLLLERTDTNWLSSRRRLTLTVLRTDGASRALYLSGPDDPRIGQAIGRWAAGASIH